MIGDPQVFVIVTTADHERFARAAEVLARAAAGLNLEGIDVLLKFDHETEEG